MKKIILLAALFVPLALHAQFSQADAAYDKGNFTEALAAYRQAAQSAQGENLYKAQLRIIASQYMLGEYLNAAKTAFTTPLPSDALWKARLLLYRIQTAGQTRGIYRPVQNHADEEDGVFENFSAAQWNDKINESFETLWALRAALIYAPLQQETLILDIKDTDLQAIPTLFDFVVLKWKERLQYTAPVQPLRAADVLSAAKIPATTSYDVQKLLSILTEAAKLGGTNRADARLIWQTDLLMLPFEQERFFTFDDKAKQHAEVISQLEKLSGYPTENKTGLLDKISKALLRSSKTDYGRAYAAFHAAQLLNGDQAFADAVALCDWVKNNLSENYYSKSCVRLAEGIRKPVLNVGQTAFSQDPAKMIIPLSVRNVSDVYVRLYHVTPADLQTWNEETTPYSWDYLNHIPSEKIADLLKRTPLHSFSVGITYPKQYALSEEKITLPELTQRGFYAAAMSYDKEFDLKKAPVTAVVLNVTDLALFATASIEDDPLYYHAPKTAVRTPNVLRLYSLDFKTGQPQPQTDITYFTDWNGNQKSAQTNAEGLLCLPHKINPAAYTSYSVLPKAVKNGSTAFFTNRIYFNFNPPTSVKLYAETDRAVYRPGQTVQIAAYGFEEAGRGWKTLPEKTKIKLIVRDANYEKVLEQTLSLNTYGTAQSQFVLPETGLLGHYQVQLSYQANGRSFGGSSSFRVEEYKRPEYEVKLDSAAKLEYDKEAHLTGSARYYFGAPVENAKVQYTVTRQPYHPPFWWWRNFVSESKTQVAQGVTATDKTGAFEIPFTPRAGADAAQPYLFEVTVSVLDDAGRAIDATQTYKASRQSVFFSVAFDKGFYDAGKSAVLGRVKLVDISGQALNGKFTAEMEELENTFPAADLTPLSRNDSSLEKWYGKNAVVRSVFKESFHVQDKSETTLQLPALPEGIYKLKLSAKNADTTELIFLVAAAQSKLALPAVAIAQQSTYYPGEQARMLIGAGRLNGPKYLEIYQDSQFLARTDRTESGVGIYTLPIQSQWRGGVYVRWFGASDYQLYNAQTFINVPFDNKALTLHIDVPPAVKPGEKVTWPVQIKNAAGAAVNGQASVRVYDKSLDYYAAAQPAFSLTDLYAKTNLATSQTDSLFTVYSATRFDGKNNYTYLQPPQLPQINLQMRFRNYGMKGLSLARGAVPMMAMAKAAVVADNAAFAADEMAVTETAAPADTQASKTDDNGTDDLRTDFSETAYFNPMLPLPGGKGNLSFTFPQSLTAWNVQALAFTPDVNVGSFTAQTVTRKDLMVRLSLPRFWREGDQSTLVAQVTNITDKKVTAEITLNVSLDGKDAAAAFGLNELTKTVTVAANGNSAVSWPVRVPQGVGVATITAAVRAGKASDAESRQLPLLPAKERLAESTTVALESGTQTLKLENLLTPDDTRRVSALTLRVDPGLFLSVLNNMPQLLRPVYNDALSQINSYVPLCVVNAFYKKYPALQQAVAKLPKRNTQTPAWDNTDPARLTLLEETPWLHRAQGGAARAAFLTDLFNPAAVEKARQQAEKNLAKYQTASGGFSWMPGGEPSEFITLRILAAYAQILRYGGEIPQASAQKALAWLAPRIEKNLKESSASASAVSYALYAAYVFTAYPQNWKAVKVAPVKKWLDYADEHSAYMTPLGQTYAAAAYYRLGEQDKAQHYLDLVLSRMKTDPVTGAYFAPEAQSWLWYNDTLSTQTATLRTLLEIRPQSDKAAELVKWLLFNRQAQVWQDTTAAAQTVYSLLDYMQRKGLTDEPADYTLQWGEQHTTLHFQPFDWSEQLSWTKEAEDVPAQYYTAQVTKRGGMTGFVTLDAVYTTAHAAASQPGVLNVSRRYLLKYTENGREKVRPLTPGEEIPVGAEIEVQLTLNASSAFDFVLLADPKPAGFENADLTSGWTWNALSYYREVRDAATHFFLNRVPAGTYALRYVLRPTLTGQYRVLPAQVQSMYAPQFSAHTAADEIHVK